MIFSFLYASRNDNYCGDSPERLFTCIRLLNEFIKDYPELIPICEIIIIDWNSEEPLYKNRHCNIQSIIPLKFIIVNPSIVKKIASSVLSEVHAYNLGARYSNGIMCFRLDQDTIIGRRFFDYLLDTIKNHKERLYKVWWSGRKDTKPDMYNIIISKYADIFIKQYENNFDIPWGYSINGEGGVGVLGIPKYYWTETTGYNEKMIHWGHMEYSFLAVLKKYGEFLNLSKELDCPFYHIYHPPFYSCTKKIQNPIDRSEYKNDSNWGLKDYDNEIQIKYI